MSEPPEFTIRNVGEDRITVGAAMTDVVLRVIDGRLHIRALAYDADRCPVVVVEPCWPTTPDSSA